MIAFCSLFRTRRTCKRIRRMAFRVTIEEEVGASLWAKATYTQQVYYSGRLKGIARSVYEH